MIIEKLRFMLSGSVLNFVLEWERSVATYQKDRKHFFFYRIMYKGRNPITGYHENLAEINDLT
jgi:hypothetical protein